MTDKLLRQDVVDELNFAPNVDASSIGVAVSNGVVTLTGHVSDYAQKLAAERAARQVKGVRAIAEEIEVRYPNEKKTADDQIAERALAILRWDAQAPAETITVRVERGWVTLTGEAPWQYQRIAAEKAIRKLSGVVGVTNEIRVTPKVISQDVRGKIRDALKRNAELDANSIMVAVHDDRVTLIGKVKTWRERDVAERAAWSAPGVTAVEDRLDIG
ncbi:MAG TPA: BON domain-containing protein [Roseiarcus sp.]|nr:BON domain-containing protein [Roseiarcus sp.]